MKRILGAIDSSAHGLRVMDYAVQIARIYGATVTGLFVVEIKKIEGPMLRDFLNTVGLEPGFDYSGKVERFLEMRSADLLSQFEEKCRASSVSFEGVSTKGIVGREIASLASRVDLIVMGRRGEHAEWHSNPLGGSVEAVVRSTRVPILVTTRAYYDFQRALVAFDGSSHSCDALRLAAEIHSQTGLEILVLSVVPEEDPDAREMFENEVRGILDPQACSYTFLVREGDPGVTIPMVATELECNLIIMGAYGHSKIREMILGSVTQQVLFNSRVPLLMRR